MQRSFVASARVLCFRVAMLQQCQPAQGALHVLCIAAWLWDMVMMMRRRSQDAWTRAASIALNVHTVL
jgi:hypothetical protein